MDEAHLAGEAALLASLRRGRTGRMGDIVATIQREQDEAIRAPLPGILVVQGGPGTGKTAVALHRAAYLLYAIANAEHFVPGEVAYADLRFDGRVVVKPLRAMPAAITLPRAVVPVQITN